MSNDSEVPPNRPLRTDAPKLRGQSDCCFLRYAAQRLQRSNRRPQVLGCRGYSAIDGSVEACDAWVLVVHFQDQLQESRVLLGVGQFEPSHPLPTRP